MAEVTVDIGNGQTVVAAVTRSSVERMQLTEEDDVVAIIKVTPLATPTS
jgi:molybdopterin-binding protein